MLPGNPKKNDLPPTIFRSHFGNCIERFILLSKNKLLAKSEVLLSQKVIDTIGKNHGNTSLNDSSDIGLWFVFFFNCGPLLFI